MTPAGGGDGGFFHRRAPDGPDMTLLYDLILQLDGEATEGGKTVEDIATPIIDHEALGWLATQRVMRAEQMTHREFNLRQKVTAAALYMEGFVMGARFRSRKRHGAIDKPYEPITLWYLIDGDDDVIGPGFETVEEAAAEARRRGGRHGVIAVGYEPKHAGDIVWSPEWEQRDE